MSESRVLSIIVLLLCLMSLLFVSSSFKNDRNQNSEAIYSLSDDYKPVQGDCYHKYPDIYISSVSFRMMTRAFFI